MDLRIGRHPILGNMDRGRKVVVYVDGEPYDALEGEPIAASLYAAGIRTTRHTSRSGEPRGPFCMIGRCTECSMTVDGTPNVKACITPVREGMRIEIPKGGRP
jgi:predicted molibdopterin-dependent oxidoreductase YjgC